MTGLHTTQMQTCMSQQERKASNKNSKREHALHPTLQLTGHLQGSQALLQKTHTCKQAVSLDDK